MTTYKTTKPGTTSSKEPGSTIVSKEKYLIDLLKSALVDLKEHQAEYHYAGKPGLIEEIEQVIKES